jgi:hypothetical protein
MQLVIVAVLLWKLSTPPPMPAEFSLKVQFVVVADVVLM